MGRTDVVAERQQGDSGDAGEDVQDHVTVSHPVLRATVGDRVEETDEKLPKIEGLNCLKRTEDAAAAAGEAQTGLANGLLVSGLLLKLAELVLVLFALN